MNAAAREVGLEHLVEFRIGHEQHLVATLPCQAEAVAAGEGIASGTEHLARFIESNEVVAGLVGEQEDIALGGLHHFMAILHGQAGGRSLGPCPVEGVLAFVLAKDEVVPPSGSPTAGEDGEAGQCCCLEERSALHGIEFGGEGRGFEGNAG